MSGRYLLWFTLEPCSAYEDPATIRWNVFDTTSTTCLQEGSIHIAMKSDFGPMVDMADFPDVLRSDIGEIGDFFFSNDVGHMSLFFWITGIVHPLLSID